MMLRMLRSHGGERRSFAPLAACLALVLLTGCGESLPTEYGRRSGTSVNGTMIFSALLAEAGFEVQTQSRVSRSLEGRADVAIWVPRGTALPSDAEREFFETWLQKSPGRVLVYLGRDFDAAPDYWREVIAKRSSDLTSDQLAEYQRASADAMLFDAAMHESLPADDDCGWFRFVRGNQETKGKPLTGDPAWTEGLDASALELAVRSEIDPAFDADVLLAVGDQPLITRQFFLLEQGKTSELYVVTNGCFLLNLPLVERERRKLAARFVEKLAVASGHTAEDPKRVMLIEAGGLSDTDLPDPETASGWAILATPPLSYVILQLAAVGIVFCMARWPIIGRPRKLPPPSLSDFGRHVEALGELLSRSKSDAYARRRVEEYYQHVKREGAGHAPAGKPR